MLRPASQVSDPVCIQPVATSPVEALPREQVRQAERRGVAASGGPLENADVTIGPELVTDRAEPRADEPRVGRVAGCIGVEGLLDAAKRHR